MSALLPLGPRATVQRAGPLDAVLRTLRLSIACMRAESAAAGLLARADFDQKSRSRRPSRDVAYLNAHRAGQHACQEGAGDLSGWDPGLLTPIQPPGLTARAAHGSLAREISRPVVNKSRG